MVIYLLFSVITTTIAIITPVLWGKIIDIMVNISDVNLLIKMGIVVSLLGLLKIIMNFISNRLYITIQTNSAMDISEDVIHHLHKISLTKLQKYDAGYLNECINHDSNSITMFFLSMLTGFLSNGLLLIIPLFIVFRLQYIIALVLFIEIVGYIVLYIFFREKLIERAKIFREAQSEFFSALLEQFKNVKFIKQHALEEFYKERFRTAFQDFFRKALSTQQFFFLYSSMDQILEVIINFCIYILGGILVIKDGLTIGSFTLVLNYYRNILSSIKYFADLGKEYQNNNVAYQRLENYLELKEQSNGTKEINRITQIRCNNLTFAREGKEILHSFNYIFEKGNIYCVQGKNGVGKTTLIDVLIGLFVDEYEGEILYNGINIKDIDMKGQRFSNISVLEQDPYVLEGSVDENIYLTEKYYKNKYGDRILDKQLGNIYNGSNGVSGGEKQKIGIIRTFAKDSDVMLLDEPTSALDQGSKKNVFRLLKEMKKEKIIIIISHDKEAKQFADYTINLNES